MDGASPRIPRQGRGVLREARLAGGVPRPLAAGLRVVGSWLAGAHHMRWRTFLLWNALGGIAWAMSIGLAAYLLGHVAVTIIKDFGRIGLALVVLGGVAFFVAHRVRKRRRATAATEAGN